MSTSPRWDRAPSGAARPARPGRGPGRRRAARRWPRPRPTPPPIAGPRTARAHWASRRPRRRRRATAYRPLVQRRQPRSENPRRRQRHPSPPADPDAAALRLRPARARPARPRGRRRRWSPPTRAPGARARPGRRRHRRARSPPPAPRSPSPSAARAPARWPARSTHPRSRGPDGADSRWPHPRSRRRRAGWRRGLPDPVGVGRAAALEAGALVGGGAGGVGRCVRQRCPRAAAALHPLPGRCSSNRCRSCRTLPCHGGGLGAVGEQELHPGGTAMKWKSTGSRHPIPAGPAGIGWSGVSRARSGGAWSSSQ